MKKYVSSNEEGITLVELLTTILLSMMIIGIIYSVLINGINAYKKIAVEGQIRDEADIIISSILNEIYKLSPDYICDNNIEDCSKQTYPYFSMRNRFNLVAKKDYYNKVEESENAEQDQVMFKLENNNIILEESKVKDNGTILKSTDRNLNSDDINVITKDSTFKIECTHYSLIKEDEEDEKNIKICRNAIITMSLTFEHKDYADENSLIHVKPITLNSSIGF